MQRCRIWEGGNKEGRVSFQKEYYHGSDTSYWSGVYTDLFHGFPKNQWIGMKFVVYTIPGKKNVQLALYVDLNNGQSGGDWQLVHDYIDQPGAWIAEDKVPSSCPIQSGDTILGPKHSCALRADGGEVHWKWASVRHILPGGRPTSPTRTPASPTRTPASPTRAPVSPTFGSPDEWTVITYDDFENGWASYYGGGSDGRFYAGSTYAHQGNNAVEIRDDGSTSFVSHIANYDVSRRFSQLRVSFWFIADGVDDRESFLLQYSKDGGIQWITERVWTHSDDFENGKYYNEVLITTNGVNSIKLRFLCDASSNNDSIYIDEVEFAGK